LWNKLGSGTEVIHSEFGPNGNIVGSSYAFEPAQFGNGYVRKATGDNYISFPSSVVDGITYRGTIEVWITPKVSQPIPYSYGIFGLIGDPYGWAFLPSNPGSNISLTWGDGVSGLGLQGTVRFDNNVASTPPEPVQFVATPGVPFHAAISWDINGIDGTADTIRVYRNGQIVGSTTGAWNPNGAERHILILGYGPDSGGYNKFITDNIVIRNYAKTDFSDRFNENPGVSCDGVIPKLSALIANKSGPQNARLWTIALTNKSYCPAENAQIDGLTLTQTYGATCAPIISTPASFPLGVGNILPSSTASGTVTVDFTGCPNNARFSATIPFSANSGAASGSKTLNNQFR
jgi:hypothetical protein